MTAPAAWGLEPVTAPTVVRAFDPPRMAVLVGVHEVRLPTAHPAHDQIVLIAVDLYGPIRIVCIPGRPGLLAGEKPRRPDVPFGLVPVAEVFVSASATAVPEGNIRPWSGHPRTFGAADL